MNIDPPLLNTLIFVGLVILGQLAFYAYRVTKRKTRSGFLGNSAVFIGSLFSSHGDMVKEIKATIQNKVKKQDPQDKKPKDADTVA